MKTESEAVTCCMAIALTATQPEISWPALTKTEQEKPVTDPVETVEIGFRHALSFALLQAWEQETNAEIEWVTGLCHGMREL